MSWELNGNANTNPNVDFLGTADQQPLVVKTNKKEALRIDSGGKVGVGTTNPASKVEIVGDWTGTEGALRLTGDRPTLKFTGGAKVGNQSWIVHVGIDRPGGLGFFRQGPYPDYWEPVMYLNLSGRSPVEIPGDWTGTEGGLGLTGDKPTIKFAGGANAGNQSWIVHVGSDGPGNLEFFRQGSAPDDWELVMSLTRDGNVIVTGDIQLTGADYAEEFDVIDAEVLAPGTVMVLDESGAVRVSDSAYDHRVAGVISGAGGYKSAVIMDRRDPGSARRALALMGKVYCKVDANFAPIGVGDLLTTSSTAGHAMKVTDRERALGSIIGKALKPLRTGRDLVPVLIALQ
jgi:hypothetical protein